VLNFTKEQRGYARQCGFTLVEMLVVMGIMSVVIMAVMSLFIPAARSTAVQTQVSDVQSNLRLAMNRMTQDLVLAGFLVNPGYTTGGTAGAIYWQGDVSPKDTDDLTIRTRTVGNAFARIIANDSTGKIGLSDVDMLQAFPVGTSLRIFDGMSAIEAEAVGVGTGYDEDVTSYYDDYVHTVTVNNSASSTIDGVVCPASLTVTPVPSGLLREAIVLKIKDNTQPPMQTIRYRVVDGALQRIINGTTTQLLASNVASVLFAYQDSATGAVKRVDITLTGQPVGLAGGGAESSTKNRSLHTSVALRNVY
jgi:prepilin-type N-terminal cleavage/methylation domain-containing protein